MEDLKGYMKNYYEYIVCDTSFGFICPITREKIPSSPYTREIESSYYMRNTSEKIIKGSIKVYLSIYGENNVGYLFFKTISGLIKMRF